MTLESRAVTGGIVVGDFQRFLALTWTLAVTDWKLRFYGSVLGYVWQLARPFAFFGVIYVVFTQIAHLGDDVKNYGVYILFALVLFNFFAEVTTGCVRSLVARENLLRKISFPRLAIPMAITLTALFNLGGTLVAVFVFAIASGVYPDAGWLELVPLILLMGLLASGIGMLLSVLFVRYRDIEPIWEVITQILFYASPVLYVTTLVDPCCQHEYTAQPLAAIMAEMRHAVIDSTAPDVAAALGGTVRLLIPLAVIIGAFALGLWMFNRESPRIAEHL
ncbi:MAG TPA: ABC transporter permease [Thermoleophilaceae bacterium]|nr:ABC transporter permease [Thermoleophilaceae bacterium]